MKNSLANFLILLVSPTLFILSCQKEFILSVSDPGYSEKTFSFNNASTVSVMTPTGLKISLPPGAFVNYNGQPVTDNISLMVKEILSPAAMILENKLTVSNGLPLESGGEFYLYASSGGNPLSLAPGSRIQMELPATPYSMSGMKVFRGVEDPVSGDVNWLVNNNSGVGVLQDSLQGGVGYNLFSDNLEWINCDRFINEPLITYSIDLENCPNGDSTSVFVHLTGRNSVLRMSLNNNRFTSDNLIAVPATIVGICSVNGSLSASIRSVTMQNGQSTRLDFKPVSSEILRNQLNNLR